MVDAIVRTLARLYVTRRNLLEWMTAAQAKASRDLELAGVLPPDGRRGRRSRSATAVARRRREAGRGLDRLAVRRRSGCCRPLVARWVSLPASEPAAEQLSADDVETLRLTARRTWRFFETFVGPEDHGLPPDNFQDDPTPVVAHRTSPTNIGMYLLATVTARDFGWIGTFEMVERLEATLATIGRLERFRGHLYNWYDTRDLRRLEPAYVSSVDSGNLAGHLLALSNACRQMIDQPLPVAAALAGIGDAITLTREPRPAHRRRPAKPDADPAAPRRGPRASGGGHRCGRRDTRGVGGAPGRARRAHADAVGRRRGHSPPSAGRAGQRARDLGRGGPAGRDQPRPRPGAAASRCRRRRPSRRSPSWPIRTVDAGDAEPPAAAAARPPARRRSPTSRCSCSGRWTSASCSTRPASCSPSASGSATATLDPSYYDLLASEARLASFLAIAKGDVAAGPLVPARPRADAGRARLGADLVVGLDVRVPDARARDARARPTACWTRPTGWSSPARCSYAAELGVPWGISESGFNARDLDQTYQYSSFGVPGLGLKRGLSEDLVIAPYATALAAMIEPEAAVRNFARLAQGRGAAGGTASARPSTTPAAAARGRVGRGRQELHGPPPGDGPGGPRQRPQRPGDGRALPRRPDRRGDRAAAPGADAARRARRPAARRGGQERRRRPRPRAAGPAPVHLAPRRDPADAPAVERPLRGDGHGRRVRATAAGATSR